MRIPFIKTSVIYHIYNRGVSRNEIFRKKSDYRRFTAKIKFYSDKNSVKVIAYCIMPNHFHLLLYTKKEAENISQFMKNIQQSYAMYYNYKYKHSGHVFQGSYKNKVVDKPLSLHRVINYILQNPVRKGLVKEPGDWRYSAFNKGNMQ